MLRLTICLLVAKTAFAANAFPIENGGYGPVGPDTNLVFNFEQIRRDQPPQIEMREENIHKYRNRPRTTTPIPIDNGDMSPMKPEHPIPYSAAQWNALQTAPKYNGPMANWKSVPAPPTFPHWDSLQGRAVTNPNNYETNYDYESQPIPQQPIMVETEELQSPEVQNRQQPIAFEKDLIQSSEGRNRAMPSYIHSTIAPRMIVPTTRSPVRHSPRGNPRGQQKFDWNDLTTQSPTTVPNMAVNAPAKAAAPGRMPPPPVPTLSPWYDGF